jgi:hypothetical protein
MTTPIEAAAPLGRPRREVGGRWKGLPARRRRLAPQPRGLVPTSSQERIPEDRPQPRPQSADPLGLLLERPEPGRLRDVVAVIRPREAPRERAQPRRFREQLLGRDRESFVQGFHRV